MAIRRSGRDKKDETTEDSSVTDDVAADALPDEDVEDVEEPRAPKEPKDPIWPGVKSLLVPMLVVALVGLLTVGSLVGAFRSFRPHELKVAIGAPQGTIDLFTKQLGSGKDPAFKFVAVPDGETSASAVQKREVYASLVLGAKAWQLQYAGANGTIINNQLTGAFQPASSAIKYSTVDVAAGAKGDRSGWTVFFLVLGVVLAAFGFGLVVGFRRQRIPARAERAALALFAVIVGVIPTLIVRFGFDALSNSPVLPCILQSLLAFSIAAITVAAVRVGRIYGAAIVAIVLVAVGTALSGALLPPPYLVPSLQTFVNIVPSGMAAQGTTGAAYFKGASFGVGLYGLIGWTIVAVALLVLVDRLRPAPVDDDEDDAQLA